MKRLRIISFAFALIMSIQMLPVAQIGCALGNNVWTEELPHNTCEDNCNGETCKSFLPVSSQNFQAYIICWSAEIYINISDQIPSNHSTDVVTPPPDVVA